MRINILQLTDKQKADKQIVANVIYNTRRVIDRVTKLNEMGFKTGYKCMDSGGVFQLQTYYKGIIMQIGYGVTRFNYAHFVWLDDKAGKIK